MFCHVHGRVIWRYYLLLVVTADGDCDDEMLERDKAIIAYIVVVLSILLSAVWYEMSSTCISLLFFFLPAIDCCETQQQSQARA